LTTVFVTHDQEEAFEVSDRVVVMNLGRVEQEGTPQHVFDHPALGPLDGYEWVLAVAAHTERHTKQILEVKADANFPAN